MKFAVEPGPFHRIVELVGESFAHRKGSDVVLCLAACDQWVWVKSGNTIAETEAMVWESGQCHVARASLLNALKKHQDEVHLRIEADKRCLRVREISLSVSGYCRWAVLPTSFQIFLASNLGVVHWREAQFANA